MGVFPWPCKKEQRSFSLEKKEFYIYICVCVLNIYINYIYVNIHLDRIILILY